MKQRRMAYWSQYGHVWETQWTQTLMSWDFSLRSEDTGDQLFALYFEQDIDSIVEKDVN